MQLAVVCGHCTATIKDASLGTGRLALVQVVDPEGAPIGPVEVALDVTSAAAGQTVLVTRGSAARQPAEIRQVAADLAVVAIVDDITLAAKSQTPISKATKPRTTKRTRG